MLTTCSPILVASCLSFIVAGCTQTAANIGTSVKSDTQSVSDRTSK